MRRKKKHIYTERIHHSSSHQIIIDYVYTVTDRKRMPCSISDALHTLVLPTTGQMVWNCRIDVSKDAPMLEFCGPYYLASYEFHLLKNLAYTVHVLNKCLPRTPQRPLFKILLPAPSDIPRWETLADMLFSNTIAHYSYSATHLTFYFLTDAMHTTTNVTLPESCLFVSYKTECHSFSATHWMIHFECARSNIISICKKCLHMHIFPHFPGLIMLFLNVVLEGLKFHRFLSEAWNPISFLYFNIVIIAYNFLWGF